MYMAIKLRNGQLDDIDTPGRLQHAHYSVKYSNCAAEPLRDMANSDRTNLLVDLIGMWRAMASKLSIEERRQISNLDNFALPCRAYIITCKEPQLTLLFVARLADSDVIEDLGEHDLSELPRVVDEFRQRCDWQHAQYHDPRSSLFPRMGLGRSSASAVEVMLLGWLRQLRHPRPTGTQTQVSSKSAVGTEGSFCWYVSGNPLKLAVQQVVDQIASEATRPKLPAQNAAAAVPEAEIDGFTTSFYPAVFVAEAEWPSFFSDAANRIREELDEVVIKVPLETSFITVTRDGEIVTGISDARRALRLLNVLFALVRLKAGCPVHSVRPSELWKAKIDPTTFRMKSSGGGMVSPRTAYWHEKYSSSPHPMSSYRRFLAPRKVQQLIESAIEVKSDRLTDELLFLLDSATHLDQEEYGQSFLFSWFVLERFLFRQWDELALDRKIAGRRKELWQDTRQWTAASVSEVLELVGRLSPTLYSDVFTLRKLRNDLVHSQSVINQKQAEMALRAASSIILSDLVTQSGA